MNILYETDKLVLGNMYEDVYLIEKETGNEIFHDDFYGDPTCGLISRQNEWAIVGGEHLTVWKESNTTKFDYQDLKWIHSIRIKNDQQVEILTDPWSEGSAIWELSLATLEFHKVRNFEDYKHKEYTENIQW